MPPAGPGRLLPPAYAKLGQPARAIEDYDQALRLKPDDADFLNFAAYAYLAVGDPARALAAAAERAVQLAPDNGSIRDTLGDMLCRNARGPEAIRAYARSRRLKPALAATKQRQMKATGHYAGPEDGSFGPASEAALAAWVKARCPGL